MGRTLVVAPWGQPAVWGKARYVLEQSEMESCTSLGLILERFKGDEVDVAILALDSLIDEYFSQPSESQCYTCYDNLRSSIREAATCKSYTDIRARLTNFVKRFVECLRLPCNPYVVICPAVGSPGGKWRFSGAPTDFEAVVLHELGKQCVEKAYTRIVLDLTHGINFMPAVVLKLAGELASLILAAHWEVEEGLENGVELHVYNSDPRPSTKEVHRLNLNLVTKDRAKTILIPHQLSRKLLRRRVMDESLKTEIDKLNNEYLDAVWLPLSTIYYPLPLALCEIMLQSNSRAPRLILERAFTLWCERMNIDNLNVKRPLALEPEAVYALLLTEAVNRWLAAGGINSPLMLETLEKLANFYKVVNESFYYLIMDEKHRIERNIYRVPGWTPLYQLVSDAKETSPDKRTMIAHAGLQKEFVEINTCTMQIRYRIDAKKVVEEAGLVLRVRD
mgnify:CR=1 FL=1